MVYFIEDEDGYFVDNFSIYYTEGKYTYCAATHINGIEFYPTLNVAERILDKLNRIRDKSGFNLKFKIKEKELGEIKRMSILEYPYIYKYSMGG
jgi:hypothetical protein